MSPIYFSPFVPVWFLSWSCPAQELPSSRPYLCEFDSQLYVMVLETVEYRGGGDSAYQWKYRNKQKYGKSIAIFKQLDNDID